MTPGGRLRTLLKVALNVLVLAFVGYILWSSIRGHEAETWDILKHFDAGTALLLLVLGIGNTMVGHLGWHTITGRLGIQLPYFDSFRVWAASLLGRYIPGKVMLLVGRTYAYRQRGQPAVWVAYAVILEHLFALCSAIIVLLVSLTQLHDVELAQLRWLGWIGLLPLALLVSPRLMNWGIGLIARRLGAEDRRDLSTLDFVLFLLVYLGGWLVLGLGNYVLIWRIGDIGWQYFLYVTGAHAVAGIAGVLSLFAPSGIGVRDGLMFFFLSRIMPAYQATLASLGLRIWLTGCELIVIGVGWILMRLPAPPPKDERAGS